MGDNPKRVKDLVEKLISENRVIVFSATYCSYCNIIKDLFNKLDIKFLAFEIDLHEDYQLIKEELFRRTNQKTVPNVFINKIHIGGCDDTKETYENGTLFQYIKGDNKTPTQYDLIVIGGGSGGIAAIKAAAQLKKKVALFDFVKPSPHGTTWGVGGTCVNVGCIPKIFMHRAAIIGDNIKDSQIFGWNVSNQDHNWQELIENIQNYIKKTNFSYLSYFRKNGIDYFNAFATFKDQYTVEATDKNGKVNQYNADNFIIATGGRPHIPTFPGNKYAISSDDLFSLPTRPGKTLIIGGSYIALESAGFLHGLGIDCTVMIRSILLRGFDQQIAGLIGSHMESIGIKFLKGFLPLEIKRETQDTKHKLKLKVIMKPVDPGDQTLKEEYYNLVLLATGRDAAIGELGLNKIGIKINEKSGKIIVNKSSQTSCPTIFAIGDVQDGYFELTPVAVKAGQHVVRNLFDDTTEMDYSLIPTTVFTPLEYGCCGLSEENAIKKHGTNVECYHQEFNPYEWLLQNRNSSRCYAKLVCLKNSKHVIGFHILGPNAGEITQGFALALKLKALKTDFDKLIGIHPTSAEVFTVLDITRSDQPDQSSCSPAGARGC